MADDNDLVRNRRVQYETAGLDASDVDPSPVAQWHRWHEEAAEASLVEPNAMTVATVDAFGVPDGRIVLHARCLMVVSRSSPTSIRQKASNSIPQAAQQVSSVGWRCTGKFELLAPLNEFLMKTATHTCEPPARLPDRCVGLAAVRGDRKPGGSRKSRC